MTRKSLLIECSAVPGDDPLPGAKMDAKSYYDWLYSKPGGDWYDGEIKTLPTPSIAEVKLALASMAGAGYAFITFSGHGYHGKERNQTRVRLRDGYLSVVELIPYVDKCTLVIDACRNVMKESLVESIRAREAVTKFAEKRLRNTRQLFDEQVANAEKGTVILYSCDLNEAAGENENGGFFSRSLIETGYAFDDGNADGAKWLPMNAAFSFAATRTTGRNHQQHPQFEPGRRLVHFPFAV